MGQPVAFFEMPSPDRERAQKFYRELFGWQVAAADPATGGYGPVDTGAGEGAIGGGIDRGRRRARKASRSTCGSMTWTPTWTGPRSWAASGWSRPLTCPGSTAGSRLHRPGRQPRRAVELRTAK
jgi:hypothetical protein